MVAGPPHAVIQAAAMRLWRERETTFPVFVRRMTPDDLDHVSGAWARIYATAREQLIAARHPAGAAQPVPQPRTNS